MNNDTQLDGGKSPAHRSLPLVKKSRLDLVILRYLAQRILVTLHALDQPTSTVQRLHYYANERRKRTHRMVIYNAQELLLNKGLWFVGFVSGKRNPANPSILEELHRVDQRLVAELEGTPGLLSYSSLELHDSIWCNLVLLNDAEVKMHIADNNTHKYAAYELAPSYYEWIRLHNGIMPTGLAGFAHSPPDCVMQLQRTKYYLFSGGPRKFSIQEVSYGD